MSTFEKKDLNKQKIKVLNIQNITKNDIKTMLNPDSQLTKHISYYHTQLQPLTKVPENSPLLHYVWIRTSTLDLNSLYEILEINIYKWNLVQHTKLLKVTCTKIRVLSTIIDSIIGEV